MLTSEKKMEQERFELTLAFHCAPALLGMKPADLISLPVKGEETAALLNFYSSALSGAGISIRELKRSDSRCLILVYRKDRLERQLAREEVADLLKRDGYPVAAGLEAMLRHLAGRMVRKDSFPHEVGLFLGYPAEDVEGFRQHGGRGYKCCGLWKVYSDVERAKKCFRQYGCCRQALCRRLEAGWGLIQLFRVA